MKETQPRRQESNYGSRFMNFWGKRGCRSRLVMVFQKARQLALIIQSCMKMLAHRTGMTLAQPIVKPFIVRVVEPLLLHPPFQVPVDFGHKTKVRKFFANLLGRFGPEWLRRDAPGPL